MSDGGRKKDKAIPKSRVRRTAKLGTVIGSESARYATTKTANLARNKQKSDVKLEQRHMEAAERLLDTLGTMKGAAMKLGQLASFIDVEFLPDEYRELYQNKLAKLRAQAPSMSWPKVEKVLREELDEYQDPIAELFEDFEEEAFAAASIGQVHRATLKDGQEVAVKVQYPGVAAALRSDMSNAGMLVRLAKALAPGLDAKAIAGELKERVLEELDYEFEAQKHREFARAYRGHPFIYVPQVVTRLSRARVLVTEYVEGADFEHVLKLDQAARSRFGEIIFRFHFGSIHHLLQFNADAHPGNYLAMADGRVAFLDFGMTKKIEPSQLTADAQVIKAAIEGDIDQLQKGMEEIGFISRPKRIDAYRLAEQVEAISGWYLSDQDLEITPEFVMEVITTTSDPRSEYFDLMRRQNIPANQLLTRRMETGVLAVLGKLRAKRNWHKIAREWWFGDTPATDLGQAERDFFADKGALNAPPLAQA